MDKDLWSEDKDKDLYSEDKDKDLQMDPRGSSRTRSFLEDNNTGLSSFHLTRQTLSHFRESLSSQSIALVLTMK